MRSRRNSQADSSRRTPVGSPDSSVSTTPPGTRRSPSPRASAAELSQSECPSVRSARPASRGPPRRGRASSARPGATSRRSASRCRGSRRPAGLVPPPRPPARRPPRAVRRVLELDLVLGQRPEQEVDVRVRESGQDAAAAQIDAFRARQCGLVRADAAGDPLAGDRQGGCLRERRLHRADDPVLEDHTRDPTFGEISP